MNIEKAEKNPVEYKLSFDEFIDCRGSELCLTKLLPNFNYLNALTESANV